LLESKAVDLRIPKTNFTGLPSVAELASFVHFNGVFFIVFQHYILPLDNGYRYSSDFYSTYASRDRISFALGAVWSKTDAGILAERLRSIFDIFQHIVMSAFSTYTLADLGFLEGGDFGNPSERSDRALRGSGLTGE